MEPCKRCEKVRELKHGSGFCASCYILAHQKDVKCVLCGNIRKLKGKGMCAPCYLARPEYVEARNARRRERYQNDPAYRAQTQVLRTRSAVLPHSVRQKKAYDRQRNYGLTPEAFDLLMVGQEGACAICRKEFRDGKDTTAHVDHDHSTGAVRGLLCGRCNRGLGCFDDNHDLLQRALQYLGR
jgi:Recombination endonuclease VII